MMRMSVKLDVEFARRGFAGEQKEVTKAALRALDRVSTTARKMADEKIRERVTLKSGTVKKAITLYYPHGRMKLVRDIVATGDPIALKEYQLRMTRAGAKFAVVKGDRKIYKRQGRIGFVVEKFGGHAFVRIEENPPGPQKARIKKGYGPSITQRFRTRAVQKAIMQAVAARWPLEFKREMDYRRSKLK
jgi:hypothetical protein